MIKKNTSNLIENYKCILHNQKSQLLHYSFKYSQNSLKNVSTNRYKYFMRYNEKKNTTFRQV